MNTIPIAAPILASDLGKDKSVACVDDPLTSGACPRHAHPYGSQSLCFFERLWGSTSCAGIYFLRFSMTSGCPLSVNSVGSLSGGPKTSFRSSPSRS